MKIIKCKEGKKNISVKTPGEHHLNQVRILSIPNNGANDNMCLLLIHQKQHCVFWGMLDKTCNLNLTEIEGQSTKLPARTLQNIKVIKIKETLRDLRRLWRHDN